MDKKYDCLPASLFQRLHRTMGTSLQGYRHVVIGMEIFHGSIYSEVYP